jgi:phosphoglycolate phosphatase-like HAD superfamily hydrolase
MDLRRREFGALMLGAAAGLSIAGKAAAQSDPLPSWTDGPAKEAILKFVRATTDSSSPEFVPPEERIAEFDQDGTLWVEHPVYTQVVYCLDRVGTLVKEKPELREREPFEAILSGGRDAIARLSMREIFEIVLETQSGMTVEEFRDDVRKWLIAARHPRWNRPYSDLVYQPMIEVLALLKANGFANFIATGGSASFVREYSSKVYDIPPERVCGTAQADRFSYKDGGPVLVQEPRLVLDNLEAGKIENFWLLYGRRPGLAFGNSSSDDEQMLEYVKAGPGARLSAAILHDDEKREYAYGPAQGLPDTKVGTFSQAMYDIAVKQGWTIVSMKNDWKRIFPFEA